MFPRRSGHHEATLSTNNSCNRTIELPESVSTDSLTNKGHIAP